MQVQLDLTSPARVLLNGRITMVYQAAGPPSDAPEQPGYCRWAGVQESGEVGATVVNKNDSDHLALVGLTNVLPAGKGWTFALECREAGSGDVLFRDAWMTAVAISPS